MKMTMGGEGRGTRAKDLEEESRFERQIADCRDAPIVRSRLEPDDFIHATRARLDPARIARERKAFSLSFCLEAG